VRGRVGGGDDDDHDRGPPLNPYDVLGVAPDASAEEIRHAYLALARRHHPDYHVGDSPAARAESERRMRAVNGAWAVLGDAARRRAFDAATPRPFRPFTPVHDDEPDPRDAPDVPYRPAPLPTSAERLATLAPVALFAVSVAFAIIGTALRVTALLGVAFVLFLLSCVGFLVVPLLALGRARRDEG